MWRGEVDRLRRKMRVVRLVTGTVSRGVVVPDVALPDGARVTVSMGDEAPELPRSPAAAWEAELAACDLP